jgi:hypothetical protein
VRRNAVVTVALVAALLLAGGCSSGSPGTAPTGSPSARAGAEVTGPPGGYTVTLPHGYRYVTDPAKAADLLRAGDAKKYPGLAAQVQAAFAQNTKLMAVRSAGGELSSISITAVPAGALTPASLGEQATQQRIAAQLATQGMKGVRTSTVTIDGRPALRADYRLTAGARTQRGVLLYATAGKTLYLAALTYQNSRGGTVTVPAAEVELVRRTLRVS